MPARDSMQQTTLAQRELMALNVRLPDLAQALYSPCQ